MISLSFIDSKHFQCQLAILFVWFGIKLIQIHTNCSLFRYNWPVDAHNCHKNKIQTHTINEQTDERRRSFIIQMQLISLKIQVRTFHIPIKLPPPPPAIWFHNKNSNLTTYKKIKQKIKIYIFNNLSLMNASWLDGWMNE